VLVPVVAQRGLERLIEEREPGVGQVDDLVTQRAFLSQDVRGPVRDAGADARRPGAADDHGNPAGVPRGCRLWVHPTSLASIIAG